MTQRKRPNSEPTRPAPDWHDVRVKIEAELFALIPADNESHLADYVEVRAERYLPLLFEERRKDETQSATAIKTQLNSIKSHAKSLVFALNSPVIEAMEAHQDAYQTHILPGSTAPSFVEIKAALAWLSLAADLCAPSEIGKSAKGSDVDMYPRAVAALAADDYFLFTQLAPNRSKKRGGYIDFLERVFKTMEITYEPDTVGREAATQWAKQASALRARAAAQVVEN